jgi:plastocyanin
VRSFSRVALLAVSLTLVLAAPALAANFSVQIRNFAFTPQSITVHAGDTVTWVNLDATAHRVHSTNGQFPDSPDLQQSQAYPVTFNTPGVYAYICGIHPQMQGSVTVLQAVATPTPTTPPPRTTAPPPSPTATPSPTPSPTATPTESPTPSPTPTATTPPSPTPSVTPAASPSPAASPLASPAVQTNTVVGLALIAVGVAILIGAFWWRFSRA